jgi:hypothetical protein
MLQGQPSIEWWSQNLRYVVARAFHHSIPTSCFKCLPGQQANLDSMDFAPMIVLPPTATVPLPLHHSVDRHAVNCIQRRPSRILRLHARGDAFVALNEIWERGDRQQRTASSFQGTSSSCAAVQSGNCRTLAHAVGGQAGGCAEGIGTPHWGWECGSRTMTKLFPHCEQSVVDSLASHHDRFCCLPSRWHHGRFGHSAPNGHVPIHFDATEISTNDTISLILRSVDVQSSGSPPCDRCREVGNPDPE